MNLNAIWEKHRKFLITVAAGLAVFMVLNVYAAGFRDQAGRSIQGNRKKAGELATTIESLDSTYDREVKDREVLEEQLENYLDKVSVARNLGFDVPESKAECQTDFARQLNRVWSAFTDSADKINLTYPPQTSVNFSLGSDLTHEEWLQRYGTLEVVSEILSASVELGLDRIETIQPQGVIAEEIPGVSDRVMLRYPVKVKLHGDFQTLRRLVQYFQRSKSYLSVELDLQVQKGEDGTLLADVVFSGIDVGKPPEDEKKRGPGGRKWRK